MELKLQERKKKKDLKKQKKKDKKKKKKQKVNEPDAGAQSQNGSPTATVLSRQLSGQNMVVPHTNSQLVCLNRDQQEMKIFIQVQGQWKWVKRCRRGSVQHHAQTIMEEDRDKSLSLYRSDGRGIVIGDCPDLDDGVVGIGPLKAKGFPVGEEQL